MYEMLYKLNIYGLLNNLLSTVFYILIIVGFWLIFDENIVSLFKKQLTNSRFRKELRKEDKTNSSNKMFEHVNLLISIVYNTKNPIYTYIFLVVSVLLFLFNIIILSRQSSFIFTMIFSCVVALAPYGYLQIKLRAIRVEGSYEAEGLVAELINQYKINYFNMVEAIDKTIPHLKNYPHSRKLLFRFSLGIKEFKTEEELNKLLKEFIYAINTEWIVMLSNNIYLAIQDRMIVTISLEDILKDLRNARNMLEETKRQNNEGFMIIQYLIPFFYIGSVYTAIKFFGFTLQKFFDYQLNTEIGFKFFIAILIFMFFNYGVMIIFKRQKFDLY